MHETQRAQVAISKQRKEYALNRAVQDCGRRLNQSHLRSMAESLSHAEYKEKKPLLAGKIQFCFHAIIMTLTWKYV